MADMVDAILDPEGTDVAILSDAAPDGEPAPLVVEQYPWEQQRGEKLPNYVAFLAFRDLVPTKRSLQATAEHSGHPLNRLIQWSGRYNWSTRAVAWDRYQQQMALEESKAKIKAMVSEQLDICEVFRSEVVVKKLLSLTDKDREALKLVDLASIFVQVSKHERFLRGEPETIIRNEQTGKGGGPIEQDVQVTRIVETVVRTRADVAAAMATPRGKQLLE